jgi:tRNA threonylcarbamoyladenosine biosynthesis protein TsaE
VTGSEARAPAGDLRRTASPEATEHLGERLAAALVTGDLVVLTGPLGAGKTCFVAGLARGLEARARVRSPSFILIHEYRGRELLLHLDLYRIETAEVDALGIEELLERGVLVVEWGEKLPAALRADALTLEFEVVSAEVRAIAARAAGARGAALLEAWRALDPRHEARA